MLIIIFLPIAAIIFTLVVLIKQNIEYKKYYNSHSDNPKKEPKFFGKYKCYGEYEYNSFPTFVLYLIGILFCSLFISFVIVFMITEVYLSFAETEEIEKTRYPIYAFEDNITTEGGVSGECFCVTAHFEGNERYYFIRNTKKGYKICNVSSNSAYIVEDNAEDPYVIVYITNHYPETFINKYFTFINSVNPIYEYSIHLPAGSITNTYNLDLN